MPFFTYNQNNSGGQFVYDPDLGLSHFVIIEADNEEHANALAEIKGIYFDGCDKDLDCSCCGDRWYKAWHNDGKPEPMIYDQPVLKATLIKWIDGYEVFVHYANGVVEGFIGSIK